MTEPTTRELLEGAARACGIEGSWHEGAQCFWTKKQTIWRPHQDMADCFEMETALKIDVRWWDEEVRCASGDIARWSSYADHNNDREATRMYASTRCAFEIGKGM